MLYSILFFGYVASFGTRGGREAQVIVSPHATLKEKASRRDGALTPEHANVADDADVDTGDGTDELDPPCNTTTHCNGNASACTGTASSCKCTCLSDFVGTACEAAREYVSDIVFGPLAARETYPYIVPEDRERVGEKKITLKKEGSHELHGYFFEKPEKSSRNKVVMFLHGSVTKRPIENVMLDACDFYQKLGYAVLAVSMCGFGQSGGNPWDEGCLYESAERMFDYLTKIGKFESTNIILHGYSLGGPIAAHVSAYAEREKGVPVGALFLDRPMPSLSKASKAFAKGIFQNVGSSLPRRILEKFSVVENLGETKKETPILLYTDNEELGPPGEDLRKALQKSGFKVSGGEVDRKHEPFVEFLYEKEKDIIDFLLKINN